MKTQWHNNWSTQRTSVAVSYTNGGRPCWSSQTHLPIFEKCWRTTDGNQISTVKKNKQANIEQGEVNLQMKRACLRTQRRGSNLIKKVCSLVKNCLHTKKVNKLMWYKRITNKTNDAV